MRGIIRSLGLIAIVLMLASPAHAITKTAKCDKAKSTAAGKLFAKSMACLTKNFGKPAFDHNACIAAAKAKCFAAFDKADAKYPADCLTIGNGGLCDDIETSARNVYSSI